MNWLIWLGLCFVTEKTRPGDGIGVNGCRISVGGSLTWDDIYRSRSGMVLLSREQLNDCTDTMHLMSIWTINCLPPRHGSGHTLLIVGRTGPRISLKSFSVQRTLYYVPCSYIVHEVLFVSGMGEGVLNASWCRPHQCHFHPINIALKIRRESNSSPYFANSDTQICRENTDALKTFGADIKKLHLHPSLSPTGTAAICEASPSV